MADIDQEINQKLNRLDEQHKAVVNKFIDILFTENHAAIKQNTLENMLKLSDQMNDFAYKNGMTEDLAKKLLEDIS